MKIWTICKKEVSTYFTSLFAYVILASFALLAGLFQSSLVTGLYKSTNIERITYSLTFLILFIIPMITSKSFAGEKKMGTDKLIFSSPISVYEVVLGKFFALLFFVFVMLLTTLIQGVFIIHYDMPHMPTVFTAYFGLLMLSALYISIGMFASSLTNNQIISGIISLTILFTFQLIGMFGESASGILKEVIGMLSAMNYFEFFFRGVISLSGIFYYISFSFIFLFATVKHIKAEWLR